MARHRVGHGERERTDGRRGGCGATRRCCAGAVYGRCSLGCPVGAARRPQRAGRRARRSSGTSACPETATRAAHARPGQRSQPGGKRGRTCRVGTSTEGCTRCRGRAPTCVPANPGTSGKARGNQEWARLSAHQQAAGAASDRAGDGPASTARRDDLADGAGCRASDGGTGTAARNAGCHRAAYTRHIGIPGCCNTRRSSSLAVRGDSVACPSR